MENVPGLLSTAELQRFLTAASESGYLHRTLTIDGDSCHLPTTRPRIFIVLARPSSTRGAVADWHAALERVTTIVAAERHLTGYQSVRAALATPIFDAAAPRGDDVAAPATSPPRLRDYSTWTPRNVEAEGAYHLDGPAPTIISSSCLLYTSPSPRDS